MRVIAGLMVCGKALYDHVFRPAHITTSDDVELDEVLDRLAGTSPRQEVYLRSVLLKVLPEEQQRNRESGLELAMKEIAAAVGRWSRDADLFHVGLRSVCEKASESWQMALHVEDRITANLSFEVGGDWKQLPTEHVAGPVRPGSSGPSRAQARSQKKQQQQTGPTASRTEPGTLTRNKVAVVVWPAFLARVPQAPGATSPATVVAVQHGYVLTKAQAQDADEEMSNEDSPHRIARQSTRRGRFSDPKKRRNSAGFFSTQDSSGLDGK